VNLDLDLAPDGDLVEAGLVLRHFAIEDPSLFQDRLSYQPDHAQPGIGHSSKQARTALRDPLPLLARSAEQTSLDGPADRAVEIASTLRGARRQPPARTRKASHDDPSP
jgi:hypothetical protein